MHTYVHVCVNAHVDVCVMHTHMSWSVHTYVCTYIPHKSREEGSCW